MTMSRIFQRLPVALLAGLMLAPFGTAHAARPHASVHVARSAVHSRQTAAVIDPAALRVPDTAFAPATPDGGAGGDQVLTTAVLDTGKFFTYFHPDGYAALGRVNGYFQFQSWTPTGSDPINFRYLASIYPSGQAALSAYDALKSFFSEKRGTPLTPCNSSARIPAMCDDGRSHAIGGTDFYYREVQVGVCVSEFVATAKTVEESNALFSQIDTTLNNITLAAVSAMSKVCAVQQKPTLTVNGLGVYHKVKGKVKLTSVLKLKEGGLFVATYVVTNATGLTPSAVIDFLKGGKTVAHADMLPAKLSDGTPYFYTAGKFAKTKFVGHLTARVTITIGTVTDVRSIQFTVKKHK